MWIMLLRQKNGQETAYSQELKVVEKHSENGNAVFPLSLVHATETASSADRDGGVDDMVDLMLNISQTNCVAPYTTVESEEILKEAHRLMGLDFSMSGKVIGQGLPFMYGGRNYDIVSESGDLNPELKETLLDFSTSREAANELLNDAELRESLGDRDHEKELAHRLENTRDENEGKIQNNTEYRKKSVAHYFENVIRPELNDNIRKLLLTRNGISPLINHDISKKELESLEYAVKYMKRFPSSYVHTNLTALRDLQKQRNIAANDLNDIMALSVAIPYCDMVITEGFWTNLSGQLSLGELFDTTVTSNLKDIHNLL